MDSYFWSGLTDEDHARLSNIDLDVLSDEALSCIVGSIVNTGRVKVVQWYLYDHLFDGEEGEPTYEEFVEADVRDIYTIIDNDEVIVYICEAIGLSAEDEDENEDEN